MHLESHGVSPRELVLVLVLVLVLAPLRFEAAWRVCRNDRLRIFSGVQCIIGLLSYAEIR